ncbi:glycosyltransferase family 4 protein [Chloroflexota bacterium]
MARRVLLVGPLFETGGISRFVGNLLGAEIGYEILHFDTKRPRKPSTAKGPVGYQTVFAAGFGWALRNLLITGWHILTLPFALVSARVDLVHIATSSDWTFWESAIYLLTSKALRRKTVFHFLSDFQRFYYAASPREQRAIGWVFRRADFVLVLSESVRQILVDTVGEHKVVAVPSSVEVISRSQMSAKAELPESVEVLFMGGSYGVRKGVNELAEAIPAVLAKQDHVGFLLCGTGDVEDAYNRLQQQGFGQSIRYLGFVSEETKSELLVTSDIYVLPSHSEGMPYSIIEAMAAALPIIATSIGSIPEVVVDGENGLLIPPGDVPALSESLEALTADRELRQTMGEANRERIRLLYSSQRAFETIRQVYDGLLSAKS